jgi:hypothetical protein
MAGGEIESDRLDLSNPSTGYAMVYGREAEFVDVMELTHSVYQVTMDVICTWYTLFFGKKLTSLHDHITDHPPELLESLS